jgi:hypothetical protein
MPYAPQTIALARQRYQEGAAVKAILAETGMNLHGLYYWLKGGPASGPRHLPPLPPRSRPRRRQLPDRQAFVARLWRTAERQVRDIEKRLGEAEQEPAERERDARTLAVLVKTLRELAAFDETAQQPAAQEDDDPVPDDIDEFRNELARRIHALVDSRTDGGGAGEA